MGNKLNSHVTIYTNNGTRIIICLHHKTADDPRAPNNANRQKFSNAVSRWCELYAECVKSENHGFPFQPGKAIGLSLERVSDKLFGTVLGRANGTQSFGEICRIAIDRGVFNRFATSLHYCVRSPEWTCALSHTQSAELLCVTSFSETTHYLLDNVKSPTLCFAYLWQVVHEHDAPTNAQFLS